MLFLPQHLKQMMPAKHVPSLGAGLVANYEKPAPDYGRLLRRLRDEPSFTAAAQAVADRQLDDDPAARGARIADRCEELMMHAGLD